MVISLVLVSVFAFGSESGAGTRWPGVDSQALSLAHRGASAAAPENTFAAFDRAVLSGADAIELDVRLTGDGRLAVIHDATVDRTTDGSGEIVSMTRGEFSRLDAGHDFGPDGDYPYRGEGLRIPTLGEVLERYPDALLNVEIKDRDRRAAREAVRLIEAHRAGGRVLLASRHHSVISEVRNSSDREIKTGASVREAVTFIVLAWLGASGLLDPEYERLQIPPSRNGIALATPNLISAAEDANIPVDLWTVNDPQEIRRLVALGASGIVTDHPERFPEAISQTPYRPPAG